MMRIAFLLASMAINTASIPAAASECASTTEIAASRAHRVELGRSSVQTEATCREYAASFYRIILTRQAAAACGVGRQSDLAAIDLEINALNDLVATKCGG